MGRTGMSWCKYHKVLAPKIDFICFSFNIFFSKLAEQSLSLPFLSPPNIYFTAPSVISQCYPFAPSVFQRGSLPSNNHVSVTIIKFYVTSSTFLCFSEDHGVLHYLLHLSCRLLHHVPLRLPCGLNLHCVVSTHVSTPSAPTSLISEKSVSVSGRQAANVGHRGQPHRNQPRSLSKYSQ